MRARQSALLHIMTIIICILMMTSQAIAAPKITRLNQQTQAFDLSKAVPGQLNYQGFLADAADSSVVTGTLEMTFRLFDSESKGAELWSETHPAVEVNNGLFQVQLGSVASFPGGLFDGMAMWLQTEVGGEALTPRKPLASVAYSHRANSAEMLLDYTLTDLDDRWVNEEDLDHLDAADGDPAEAVYVDDAGMVGIGTASPLTELDVSGSVNATTYFGDGSNLTGISMPPDADWTIVGADMYSAVSGNVGIGTANPGAPLEVTYDNTSSTHPAIAINNDNASGQDALDFQFAGATKAQLRVAATGGLHLGTVTSGDLNLWTNNNVRMHITPDGKVGIGTTSPARALQVAGHVEATAFFGDGSNLTGIAGAPDADWTTSNDTIYHQTGIVGIGTACPAYPLHVYNYAGYSPAYAGYFHAVGHEATGDAYAVYANAQADDENAYGIYSTAASTWGQAWAGYFDGNVKVNSTLQADSLHLGSSAKAGMDGHFLMYRDGTTNPIIELSDKYDDGGIMWICDGDGYSHIKIETDVDGSGAWFNLYRSNAASGLTFDGNYSGTEEPRLSITGSTHSALFRMDQSGDNSVVLPTGAISAGEILDEPGVSNSLGSSFYAMGSGNIDYAVDTVAITIPGPGYVQVTGGCYLALDHSVGTDTRVFVAIDKTPAFASFTFPGAQVASVPGVIPSSDWGFPCTTTRFYEEGTAGAKIYYLNVEYNSGTSVNTAAARIYLRATYYPTLYGTVMLAETDGVGDDLFPAQGAWDGSERGPEPRRRSITIEDHNARLEAEMVVLRDELEALKEEVQNQRRQ